LTLETGESKSLLEVVGAYVASFKSKDNLESVHRELYRFVQWCGPDKKFDEVNPSDIGEYAEQVGGTGTSPQATERLQAVRNFLSFARKKGFIEVNLAQHVRIRKSKTRSRTNKQQAGTDLIELTAQGHSDIVEQLEKLKAERAPLAIQIQKAAADKDVRENAPLEAAREQLGLVESRIREIENTLKIAVVVDPTKGKRSQTIKIGSKIAVKDIDGGRQASYTLVGQTEANPLEARISNISPLGKALIGRRAGSEVEVDSPRGKIRYSIIKVS